MATRSEGSERDASVGSDIAAGIGETVEQPLRVSRIASKGSNEVTELTEEQLASMRKTAEEVSNPSATVEGIAASAEQAVVVADGGAGQHPRRVEPVQLGAQVAPVVVARL